MTNKQDIIAQIAKRARKLQEDFASIGLGLHLSQALSLIREEMRWELKR